MSLPTEFIDLVIQHTKSFSVGLFMGYICGLGTILGYLIFPEARRKLALWMLFCLVLAPTMTFIWIMIVAIGVVSVDFVNALLESARGDGISFLSWAERGHRVLLVSSMGFPVGYILGFHTLLIPRLIRLIRIS